MLSECPGFESPQDFISFFSLLGLSCFFYSRENRMNRHYRKNTGVAYFVYMKDHLEYEDGSAVS